MGLMAEPITQHPPGEWMAAANVTSRDGSLVNLDDGLVGVVFLACLARVVFAGGVKPPRDVSATPAFADDDENVVRLTPPVRGGRAVGRSSRPRR